MGTLREKGTFPCVLAPEFCAPRAPVAGTPRGECQSRGCTAVPLGGVEGRARPPAQARHWGPCWVLAFLTVAFKALPCLPLLPCVLTPPPRFPFPVSPVHRVLPPWPLCSLCPLLRKLSRQTLLRGHIPILWVLTKGFPLPGFPDTGSRAAPPPCARARSALPKVLFVRSPTAQVKTITCMHLFTGVSSVLPGGGLVSLGHGCNPVTQSIPNVFHKHLRT